jgi:hypothetical protein
MSAGGPARALRDEALARLLRSREPSIRWKARVGVRAEDPESRPLRRLQEEIRRSPRARALRRDARRPGRRTVAGVYHKWLGCHWALAALADLGYPSGDPALLAAASRAIEMWLAPRYYREFRPRDRAEGAGRFDGVPCLRGRYRRCASQQGNTLLYCTMLGFDPGAQDRLAERLRHWQWPDGGWNCDRDPGADTSAFAETLTPMLGLYVYGSARRDPEAVAAARRASEVFLRRRLYRRVSDGKTMRPEFARLHYPLYWHYDLLGGLKALSRMGLAQDPRCADALDRLESKELPVGGWPAEGRFYDLPGEHPRRGADRVRWGGNGRRFNEWVTVDALTVLRAAGRYEPAG